MQIKAVQLGYSANYPTPINSATGRTALSELIAHIPNLTHVFLDGSVIVSTSTNSAVANPTTDLAYAINLIKTSYNKKIILRLRQTAGYDPTFNNPVAFLQNYATAVRTWADWCRANNVDFFIIGAELEKEDTYSAQWNAVIDQAEAGFPSGLIGYETNHWFSITNLNTKLAASWMSHPDLDLLGISAYSPVVTPAQYPASPGVPSVAILQSGWHFFPEVLSSPYPDDGPTHPTDIYGQDTAVAHYQRLVEAHGKKAFLNMGLQCTRQQSCRPWVYATAGIQSNAEQEAWFKAFFAVFGNVSWVQAVLCDGAWHIETLASSSGTTQEFDVQNRPSTAVIKNAFGATPTQNKYVFSHWQDGDINPQKMVTL